MDTRLPEGFTAETKSNSSGNQLHVHGLTTGQGLVIAGIASLSLGLSGMTIVIMLMRDQDRAHEFAQLKMEQRISQEKLNKLEPRVNQLERPHAEF